MSARNVIARFVSAMRIAPLLIAAMAVPAARAQQPTVEQLPAQVENAPLTWNTGPYSYDASGNLTAIGSQYFVYDPISRLKTAHVASLNAGATQSFSYDPYGNLTSASGYGPDLALSTDSGTNHLNISGAAYDDAGNLKQYQPPGTGVVYNYDYDAAGMMTGVRTGAAGNPYTVKYIYTAGDQRLWTNDLSANDSHFTLRDLNGAVLTDFELKGAAWSLSRDYVYEGNAVAASISPTGAQYYSLDHLGTPRLITDDQGYVSAFQTFLPFGQELAPRALADGAVQKFVAHERDADPAGIGNPLDYMHARFYNGISARFLSPDPVLGAPGYPQSWNRYAYVQNQPLLFIDPDGLMPRSIGEAAVADGPIVITAPEPSREDYERDLYESGFLQRWLRWERDKALAVSDQYGRRPDYISLTPSWTIPIPHTLGLLSYSPNVIVDRYGRVYWSPLNFGLGKTFMKGIAGSATAGWLIQKDKPGEHDLKDFITGWGANGSVGNWFGGGVTWGGPGNGSAWGPGNGFAVELGLVTPQAGVSGGYTWQLPIQLGHGWD